MLFGAADCGIDWRPVVLVAGDVEEVTAVSLTVAYDYAWAVRKNPTAGYGSLGSPWWAKMGRRITC